MRGGGSHTLINLSWQDIYPIGAIYLSTNSTSPASLFGGTWEQIKDKFLLGAGDSYTAGSTGGEVSHTLTISEMPEHSHAGWGEHSTLNWDLVYYGDNKIAFNRVNGIASSGESLPHNNMPPYLTIYMWKRVS